MKKTNLDIDLQQLLLQFSENIKKNINCIQVGQIIKFYPENKTADVNICFKQKKGNDFINYPLLLKCPVLGNKITVPVEEGEFCIVLFNDRNIDSWWETGEVQAPYTEDKHNISDGLVICGLNSFINAINYDNSAICLNYKTKINGETDINGETTINDNTIINGDTTINGNNTIQGNTDSQTYSTGGVVGVSGSFANAMGHTLTITNGLITNIS